ncbi:hypothetical protein RJ640_025594 [Escallonia rubra]|uniref:Mon2/Sec7/BIG1-like dimerisation and cyclophilin-binding domain-containing protein n=1 Tax=Escallonia rubra TaxID=112253 RepID=A0AA88QGM2_9ASTE|nr:hypothetical protein RJ640_025594 [Escallonia rubra]
MALALTQSLHFEYKVINDLSTAESSGVSDSVSLEWTSWQRRSIADHLSLADSEFILGPIIDFATSNNLKIAEQALDCIQKLISHGYLHDEADPATGLKVHHNRAHTAAGNLKLQASPSTLLPLAFIFVVNPFT